MLSRLSRDIDRYARFFALSQTTLNKVLASGRFRVDDVRYAAIDRLMLTHARRTRTMASAKLKRLASPRRDRQPCVAATSFQRSVVVFEQANNSVGSKCSA